MGIIYIFNHKHPEPFGEKVTEPVGAVTELAEVAEPTGIFLILSFG